MAVAARNGASREFCDGGLQVRRILMYAIFRFTLLSYVPHPSTHKISVKLNKIGTVNFQPLTNSLNIRFYL
jgi:hypothetical protein